MISSLRSSFNQAFTEEKYQAFLQDLYLHFGHEIEFRIAETPVFIPYDLRTKLLDACEHIVSVLLQPDFLSRTDRAIPADCRVPGEDGHTQFLAIDFAVCRDANGALTPQLIEMQGFPSLYAFQDVISMYYRKHFEIPQNLNHLFSGLDSAQYRALLGEVILNGHPPENVILMDIEPELQKTKVDFMAVEMFFGVRSVCISGIIKEGKKLYYLRDGEKTEIHRIYNRVIFDELEKRTDLKCAFHMTEEVDVEWAGHPNWFFRISKFSMPLLNSPYVPPSKYLSDYQGVYPQDLENYVLKPLFSFAGSGVIYDVKPEDIAAVSEPWNYILQKKIHYAPAFQAPDGEGIKTEIRMLYLWPQNAPRPIACTNLIRFSKGVMMGVKFNRNKTWVGGSTAFFETKVTDS
jgi:hypothetical protein